MAPKDKNVNDMLDPDERADEEEKLNGLGDEGNGSKAGLGDEAADDSELDENGDGGEEEALLTWDDEEE